MKSSPRIATAVAVGYALGRNRRIKLAVIIGGLLTGRRVGDPRELLAKASSAVSSPPGLSQLSSTLRGRLVESAKTAAVATASDKIDSVGESLTERAGKIRSPHPGSVEATSETGRAEEEPAGDGQPEDAQERQSTEESRNGDRAQKRSMGSERPAGTRARRRKPDTSRAASSSRDSSPKRPKGVSSSASGARSRRGGGDHD
jgi:hypothetical protein